MRTPTPDTPSAPRPWPRRGSAAEWRTVLDPVASVDLAHGAIGHQAIDGAVDGLAHRPVGAPQSDGQVPAQLGLGLVRVDEAQTRLGVTEIEVPHRRRGHGGGGDLAPDDRLHHVFLYDD